MIWRLRRHDPSFSSMKEKSLESRRVRTQPRTWTDGIGASLASAALTEVGPDMPEVGWGLSVRQAGCSDAALSAYERVGRNTRVFTATERRRYSKKFRGNAFRRAKRA